MTVDCWVTSGQVMKQTIRLLEYALLGDPFHRSEFATDVGKTRTTATESAAASIFLQQSRQQPHLYSVSPSGFKTASIYFLPLAGDRSSVHSLHNSAQLDNASHLHLSLTHYPVFHHTCVHDIMQAQQGPEISNPQHFREPFLLGSIGCPKTVIAGC
jgi:hypothetical protein